MVKKTKSRKNTNKKRSGEVGAKHREVVGYFLQTDRELVRDEFGRLRNMYDKYIAGKDIQKKINTFDGISIAGMSDAFFIDFKEFKPKVKKLTAHETMQGIIKKAATDGVISKGLASSFKLGKITAPVVNGKIELDGLEFEKLKVKPPKKSTKKELSISDLAKQIHSFLVSKGYVVDNNLGKIRLSKSEKKIGMLKKGKRTTKKIRRQSRMFLLKGAEWWVNIESSSKYGYTIGFVHELLAKRTNEHFHGNAKVFDNTDKKVLLEMLKRLGIKPSKKSSVSTQQYKSKGTKTKVTTIAVRGKKFSITGTITGFTRDAFVGMIEKLGGKFQNHVSKDLDILIVGEKPGKTKIAQAKKYNIEVVKFNELLTIMHNGKQ